MKRSEETARNLDLKIINPISFPEWDNLLSSKEDSSFFHSSHWAKVLSESYHYNPLYFTLIENNNLHVGIPFMEVKSILTGQRGISLPFSDYCTPIVSQEIDFEDVFKQLVEYGEQHNWKYIEIRNVINFLNGQPHYSYYVHTLDLSKGKEQLYSGLRSNTKRNIKKAIKEGVETVILNSPESLNEFYRLNCITRKDHGLPPQPYYFFERVYENVIKKKLGLIVLAYYQKKAIAGAMYFHVGDKALFKYGASEKKYLHLRPNNLVMWEAIKWYSLNRFKHFSFGRTDKKAEGLRQFKAGWGSTETTIKYYTYDLKKRDFIKRHPQVSGIHNKVFNNMPIYLLKLAGSLLYRHMG